MKETKEGVHVTLEITNDELTDQERAELLEGAKDLLHEIFGKDPDAEVVVVDDSHTAKQDVDRGKKSGKIIPICDPKLKR